jgi:hypothetical protein
MGLTSFNRSRRLAAEQAEETAPKLPESALEQTELEPEQEPKPSSKKPRKPPTTEV